MKRLIKSRYVKFVIPVLIVIMFFLCILLFNETSGRINSIENYENIFQSVNELEFFIEENNFYSTKSPSKELRTIKKVRVNPESISAEINTDRDFQYKIKINNKFVIYINSDFSQLWLDDTETININYNSGSWDQEVDEGEIPSSLYTVENPEVLENLFKEHSQHIN